VIDLSQSVHLSSGDVTTALASFFHNPMVMAVMALVIALLLVNTITHTLHFVSAWVMSDVHDSAWWTGSGSDDSGSGDGWETIGGHQFTYGDRSSLSDWNLDASPAGEVFMWRESTPSEMAALDPGLPDIYWGHDPDDFDAIQAESYDEFMAEREDGDFDDGWYQEDYERGYYDHHDYSS
jgi:hypothetical protein